MIYRSTIFLILSALTLAQYCPKFVCNSTSLYKYSADPEICSTRSDAKTGETTFKLSNKCTSSTQYCNFSYTAVNSTCAEQTAQTAYLYPGDPCTYPENCISGVCRDNVCVGLTNGTVCKKDYECDTGMYCSVSTGKCNATVVLGAACGDKVARCKYNLACVLGKCTAIGSLEDGTASDNVLGCKNFYILKNDTGVAVCATGPSLDTDPSTPCKLGQVCNYTIGTKKFSTPCKCGINPSGLGYCAPGEGKLASDIALFYAWAGAEQSDKPCHVESPWFCPKRRTENTTNYHKGYAAYINLTLWENLIGQDACSSNNFFSNYWYSWKIANFRNATPPSFGILPQAVSLFALLAMLAILLI